MSLSTIDARTMAAVRAYDEFATEHQFAYRRRRPTADVHRFAAWAEKGTLVLDAGCGPASDMRLLRDAGMHAVGVDLSLGALKVARMLLPRDPLIQAPLHDLPFRPSSFGGLWMSGTLNHLPRAQWQSTLDQLFSLLSAGPVYFSCLRGNADMRKTDDPVLGPVHVSCATEEEVGAMMASRGVRDLQVELRPDPLLDRKRPWVVALGQVA